MELKQLQSFVAVVDFQSFTKAAEALYISQPTISAHIRMLEEEFSLRLILRTTQSIQVTPRGRELYDCARSILALRDGLVRRWSQEDGKVIQLATSTIPSAYILPEILPAFRQVQPDIRFHIHQSDSQGVLEGLSNGTFEAGLLGAPSPDPLVESLPFYRDTMVLITPVTDFFLRLRDRGPISLEEIVRQPILLRERGSGSKKCVDAYLEAAGIQESDLQVTARLNDQESIKSLVAGGLGVSIISAKAAQNFLESGKLLSFTLPGPQAERYLYLAYRKDDYLREHTRRFLDFVRNFYAPSLAGSPRCGT